MKCIDDRDAQFGQGWRERGNSVINRVENVALPYLNSPNYDYGTTVATAVSGNEIFENVMQKAAISSLLNDSQDQGSASGGSENRPAQDEDGRYSEDLRKAWETLRAQEETFYRTRQAIRNARKPIPETKSSDATSTGTGSTFSAAASTAANVSAASSQSPLTSGASNLLTAESPYAVAADGTVMMEQIFQKAAAKYGVSSNLLKAVAKEESGYQPGVVSYAGAIGVMQLMPGTASSLGVTDPYDAEQNIMGGARLLSQLLAKYNNNLDLALAAYNAGPGNVAKYGGAPPYTQNYISAIKAIMNNGEQTIDVPVTIASTAGTAVAETADTAPAAKQTADESELSKLSALLGSDTSSLKTLLSGDTSSLRTLLGSDTSALTSLLGGSTSSLSSLLGDNASVLSVLSSIAGSSAAVSGDTLGNLARLTELQTLNSATSTLSSFGRDDDDSPLI